MWYVKTGSKFEQSAVKEFCLSKFVITHLYEYFTIKKLNKKKL